MCKVITATILAALVLTASAMAQPDARPLHRLTLPQGVIRQSGLTYARLGKRELKLDLYLPAQRDAVTNLPIVVWVHGGGWRQGSKNLCPATFLAARGYAVASVEYRLTGEAVFPAQIHDCKAAIRWLRANAATYQLDDSRIGAWGSSAGGHLVALLGTSGNESALEGDLGEHRDQSSAVQAVVDYFGPSDFLPMLDQPSIINRTHADDAVSQLLGGPVSERRAEATTASPVTHVDPTDPPFLIVHGKMDRVVPHNQSVRMNDALGKAGVASELITLQDAGHGGREFFTPDIQNRIVTFLDQHLKAQH